MTAERTRGWLRSRGFPLEEVMPVDPVRADKLKIDDDDDVFGEGATPIADAAAAATPTEKKKPAAKKAAKPPPNPDGLDAKTLPDLKTLARERNVNIKGMRSKVAVLAALRGEPVPAPKRKNTAADDPPPPPPLSERKKQPVANGAVVAARQEVVPEPVPPKKQQQLKPNLVSRAKAKAATATASSRKRAASSALTEPDWEKHRRLHKHWIEKDVKLELLDTVMKKLGDQEITLTAKELPAFLALADRAHYTDAVRDIDRYRAALAVADGGDESWNNLIAASARREEILGFELPVVPAQFALDVDEFV